MIDGSPRKWQDDDEDTKEWCEKSVKVDTPESDESPLIDDIVSSDVIYSKDKTSFSTSRFAQRERKLTSRRDVSVGTSS